jgi:hypothetical protein
LTDTHWMFLEMQDLVSEQKLTLLMSNLKKLLTDFAFNSLKEPENPYFKRYEKITVALASALFYFFPFFDREHLVWMFPKRQKLHQELDIFLNMMDDIITRKRAKVAEQKKINELSVAKGFSPESSKRHADKDILTLFIESANDDENKDLSIADNDMLMVCTIYLW